MRVKPKDIIISLKQTGSASQTAKDLGISRQTVYRWRLKARNYHGQLIWHGLTRLSPDSHYPTNRPYWCQEDPEGAGTSGFRPDSPSLPQGQRIGFKTDKIQETTFPKWLSYETS